MDVGLTIYTRNAGNILELSFGKRSRASSRRTLFNEEAKIGCGFRRLTRRGIPLLSGESNGFQVHLLAVKLQEDKSV